MLQVDAVRDVQAGVAPFRLDEPDHVAGQAFGLELGVDGGVEGDHAHVAGQGPPLGVVAGAQDQLVLARLEGDALRPSTPSSVRGQSPRPHRGGDALGVLARGGARGRRGTRVRTSSATPLTSSVSTTSLTFTSSSMRSTNGAQALGTARGHRERAQRQAGPAAVGLAHGVGGRADVAHEVHGLDELGDRPGGRRRAGQSARWTLRSPVRPR